MVGRHGRPGLGHQRRVGRPADVRDDPPRRPDFFIHCGDTIYADAPLPPEMRLPDGTIWKNLVTPAKSKVAETLDEFRGNYAYNLLDEHVRRFNAEIPQIVLWDDHEVKNNWYPGMSLEADDGIRQKDPRVLAANATTGVSRVLADSPAARRATPAASTGRRPTVRCSTCSRSTCGPIAAPTRRTGRPAPSTATRACRRQAAGVAEEALRASTGDVEGDRQRPADRARRARRRARRSRRSPTARRSAARPGARDRRSAALHAAAEDSERRVGHRRRALRGRASLPPGSRRASTDFDPFWEFVAGPLHAGTGGP